MNYTDTQLKQALAKMLPERVGFSTMLQWRSDSQYCGRFVLDTELLHLCWLVEDTLNKDEMNRYEHLLTENNTIKDWARMLFHATWQQRTIALAKVKGIEI